MYRAPVREGDQRAAILAARPAADATVGSWLPLPDFDVDLARRHIVHLYLRSDTTMCMFGAHPLAIPEELNMYYGIPGAFTTIMEARCALYSVSDAVTAFNIKYHALQI